MECNCTWPLCPVHTGSLCSNEAFERHCEGCDRVHFIGDIRLGDGIHLCVDCGTAIANILFVELTLLMEDIGNHLPVRLRKISEIIAEHYTNVAKESGKKPVMEAIVVLGFAALLSCDPTAKITTEEILRIEDIVHRLSTLQDSLNPTIKETA